MPPRKQPNPSPYVGRELRKSSIPLKQARFPAPNKRVRTYGTKGLAGRARGVPKLRKQDTLTQLWMQEGSEVEEDDKDVDETGSEEEEGEERPKRRSAKRKSGMMSFEENEHEEGEEDEGKGVEEVKGKRKRRRKTAGDEVIGIDTEGKKRRRRTWGGSTVSESQQTLTQMVLTPRMAFDADEDEDPIVDEGEIYDVPSSSQYQPPFPRRRMAKKMSVDVEEVEEEDKGYVVREMPPPSTPHRRVFRQEIPSSQSPATPCSTHSRSGRTPLIEKSLNAPIPFSTNAKPVATQLPPNRPRLVVRDTFETTDESQATRIFSTPSKKSSPAKSVRFNLPDDFVEDTDEEVEDDTSSIVFPGLMRRTITGEDLDDNQDNGESEKEIEPSNSIGKPNFEDWDGTGDVKTPTQFPESARKFRDKFEILDSDEEDNLASASENENDNDTTISHNPTEAGPLVDDLGDMPPTSSAIPMLEVQNGEDDLGPDTCYDGNFGVETQFEAEQIVSSMESSKQRAKATSLTSKVVELGTHSDGPRKTSHHMEETQMREGRSQFVSQRLSTQHADDMAPRTADSDAFISLHPSQIQLIRNRTKDHVVKRWPLPSSTVRVWIYETDPKSRVKYMATIGPAQLPGDISDERGVGNGPFNTTLPGSPEYAYEILDLYELADPVSLVDIKDKGWFKAAPSKFIHVRPVPLDELMANLLPPIFTRYDVEDESEEPPDSSLTDTQEATAQLAATIQQFTQPPGELNSDPPISRTLDEDDTTSEPQLPPFHAQLPQTQPPRPSQAETVDLTQTQGETPIRQSLPDIVWESPTRPVLSSTQHLATPRIQDSPARHVPSSSPRLPKSRRREHASSQFGGEDMRSDSVIPFSIPSSQFLTKSQMLPDSLINNSIPGPAMFVGDSDEEDDDDDEL